VSEQIDRVLVVGATGSIGRLVVAELVGRDIKPGPLSVKGRRISTYQVRRSAWGI
jgi:uncharacterized protein YbjT (DUF2867 family)